jgi:hypothetical protein
MPADRVHLSVGRAGNPKIQITSGWEIQVVEQPPGMNDKIREGAVCGGICKRHIEVSQARIVVRGCVWVMVEVVTHFCVARRLHQG